MLIALISDIHDHSTRLLTALARAAELGCTHLLCMGDIATISTFRLLCEEWGHGADIVFGNNEFQRESFLRVADEYPHITLHGDTAALQLGGRDIFFCHFPHMADRAAESGQFDAVFFGHTHRAELHPAEESEEGGFKYPLMVNPGDVQGRSGIPSMAVYDTETNRARLIRL